MNRKRLIVKIGSQEFAVDAWASMDTTIAVLNRLTPVKYLYTEEAKELDTMARYAETKPGELYYCEIELTSFEEVYTPEPESNTSEFSPVGDELLDTGLAKEQAG
jgi:hypothetical protein